MINWIIWGSGGNSIDLGVVEHQHCETCERERPFRTILHYRYAHLYWVFSFLTKKEYLLLCDICSRGWTLNTAEVEKTLTKNPIPFIRQWGWTILVGLIVIPSTVGVVSSLFK
jgi:hypothetical protein